MAAKWKLLFYDHRLRADDPQLQGDAAAFMAWRPCVTEKALESVTWVKSFLEVATAPSAKADDKAVDLATTRFQDWVNEGPAAGLKRQHLFSRTATGWHDDTVAAQPTTNLSEMDEAEPVVELHAAWNSDADNPALLALVPKLEALCTLE